jgi:hypothetical protein
MGKINLNFGVVIEEIQTEEQTNNYKDYNILNLMKGGIKKMEKQTENKEEYNGWTNRETWALNLHLTNDQSLYNEVLELLKESHKEDLKNQTENIYKIDNLKEWVEDNFYNCLNNEEAIYSDLFKNMVLDVGSLWRVNWLEVVKAFEEDYKTE